MKRKKRTKTVKAAPRKARARKERDALGTKTISGELYSGIFAARARENFPISNARMPFAFYSNLAQIKQAAARVHVRVGKLDAAQGKAIEKASIEFQHGHFVNELNLDVYQAGAGTPFNMLVNEILANRALELLGKPRGSYGIIHPNNHVNMAQSTNDVIPTTLQLTILGFGKALEAELEKTVRAVEQLGKKYSSTLKVGRTHGQAAVPISLGEEFQGYAEGLKDSLRELQEARKELYELPIGGTAVGTGITTHPGYDGEMVKELKVLTKEKNLRVSGRKPYLQSHTHRFETYMHALETVAQDGMVWMNDWILLSTDPYTGIGELHLPEVEPGSSIMPGKVNPSILEAFRMVCLRVLGNAETVRAANESTILELNTMTPVMGYSIVEAQQLLTSGLHMLRTKCVENVHPTPKMKKLLEESMTYATALNPYLGYEVLAHLIHHATLTHTNLEKLLVGGNILTQSEFKQLTRKESVAHPHTVDQTLKQTIRSRPAFKKIYTRLSHAG